MRPTSNVAFGSLSLCRPRFGRMALLNAWIRRECLNHFVVLSEVHLQRILQRYTAYYNDIKCTGHWIKMCRSLTPVQRTGIVSSYGVLDEIHYH